jgi:hypothetical protein
MSIDIQFFFFCILRRLIFFYQMAVVEVAQFVLDNLSKGGVAHLSQQEPITEPLNFYIICVGRYAKTKQMEAKNAEQDLFDVLLLDGDEKTIACSLSPLNFPRVLHGEIHENQIVHVKEYKVLFDELVIGGGSGVPVIVSLDPFLPPGGDGKMKVMKKIEYTFEKPLWGGRGFYLSISSDDCIVSTHWMAEDISLSNTCIMALRVDQYSPTIQEIMNMFYEESLLKKRKRSSDSLPLIGRVLAIGTLNYYGKSQDNHPYPINFQMIVGDAERSVSVSVWNSACQLYYPSLEIGDIVIIGNYKIKHSSYANALRTRWNSSSVEQENVEVCVNAKNPEGFIYNCSNKYMGPPLPSMNYLFSCSWLGTILDLSSKPIVDEESIPLIDVAGIITFDGRPRCLWNQKLLQYKWVKIWIPRSKEENDDETDGEEIVAKIFSSSQNEAWNSISIKKMILLTNLSVKSFRIGKTTEQLHFYLQSTPTTRIFVQPKLPQFVGQSSLAEWQSVPPFSNLNTSKDSALEPTSDPLYPLTNDFDSFALAFPEVQLTPFYEIPTIATSLRYSQDMTVLMQGHITKLYPHLLQKPRQSRRSQRRTQTPEEPQPLATLFDTVSEWFSSQVNSKKVPTPAPTPHIFIAEISDLNMERTFLVDFAIPPQSFPTFDPTTSQYFASLPPHQTERPWEVLFPNTQLPPEIIQILKGEGTESSSLLKTFKYFFVAHLHRMVHDSVIITITNCFRN